MSTIAVAVTSVDVVTEERRSAPRLRLPPLDRAITGRVDTTDQVTVTRAITSPVDTTPDRVTVSWATMQRPHIERRLDGARACATIAAGVSASQPLVESSSQARSATSQTAPLRSDDDAAARRGNPWRSAQSSNASSQSSRRDETGTRKRDRTVVLARENRRVSEQFGAARQLKAFAVPLIDLIGSGAAQPVGRIG